MKTLLLLLVSSMPMLSASQPLDWTGYKSCSNAPFLKNRDRMDFRVKFSVSNPKVKRAFLRALAYYEKQVLDMRWSETRSYDDCALAVVDAQSETILNASGAGTVAVSQLPQLDGFNGLIAVNPKISDFTDDDEMFAVAIHELGHTFGLMHSKNQSSVMFAKDCNTNSVLDSDDLRVLALRHSLHSLSVSK